MAWLGFKLTQASFEPLLNFIRMPKILFRKISILEVKILKGGHLYAEVPLYVCRESNTLLC